jgi:hypothetical protein
MIQRLLEEAHKQEEPQCAKQREIKERVHEEMKGTTHEEALHDLGHEKETKDQARNFLRCFLIFLSDLDATKKLTKMLATYIGEEGMERAISTPLPKRD